MEISHGRVGTHSDAPGQVTSPSCSPTGGQCGPPLDLRVEGEDTDSVNCRDSLS